MTRRAVGAAATVLVTAALLGGCTSSSTSGTPSTSVSSSPTDTATQTDAPTDLSTAPSTATSSASTSASSSATKPPGDDCTAAQLTVRVLPSSGAQQQEFALITFTNSSTKACSLFGYPGVSLRRANALLGSAARRNTGKTPATVHLAPGAQAEAMLTDFSSCQAPLSDTVRVYPPNSKDFIDRPTQLRGCQIVVDPVTHS